MERTLFITDGDTPLGGELARIFSAKGCRVLTTVAPGTAEPAAGGMLPKSVAAIPWNRRSPLSARNVLLTAENLLRRPIDEALVLDVPRAPALPIHELAASEIERAFDSSLKSSIFLLRELVQLFLGTRSGVLGLVSFSTRASDGNAPALERALREGFKGFASSLIAAYAESGFTVNAFQSFATSPEEFARFIEKTLEEKARKISGRWFTCQPRAGFLQGVLSGSGRA